MPEVSIIIPTRNRFDLLQRAIDSVMKQTFKDWELLIIDDASTDQTDSFSIQDERIKYIKLEKQSGGAVARNKGIQLSQGSFVAFLDDDDEWLPLKLEKQLQLFQANSETGICYTGRNVIKQKKLIWGFNKRYSFRHPPEPDHFHAIMNDNFIGITSTVMIPGSILKQIKFDEQLPCFQDYDLFIRILRKWKAAGINEPLVNYYLGESSEHVSFTKDKVKAASEYLKTKYKDEKYSSDLEKAIRMINVKKMIKSFNYAKEILFR